MGGGRGTVWFEWVCDRWPGAMQSNYCLIVELRGEMVNWNAKNIPRWADWTTRGGAERGRGVWEGVWEEAVSISRLWWVDERKNSQCWIQTRVETNWQSWAQWKVKITEGEGIKLRKQVKNGDWNNSVNFGCKSKRIKNLTPTTAKIHVLIMRVLIMNICIYWRSLVGMMRNLNVFLTAIEGASFGSQQFSQFAFFSILIRLTSPFCPIEALVPLSSTHLSVTTQSIQKYTCPVPLFYFFTHL